MNSDVYHDDEALADPGIFAIANPDGSVNSSANPVKAGSYLVIDGTGQGLATTAQTDGAIQGGVMATPLLPVTAMIDNRAATVLYAGSGPGLVAGVLQINLAVPNPLMPGSHSLVIDSGGWDNANQKSMIYRKW